MVAWYPPSPTRPFIKNRLCWSVIFVFGPPSWGGNCFYPQDIFVVDPWNPAPVRPGSRIWRFILLLFLYFALFYSFARHYTCCWSTIETIVMLIHLIYVRFMRCSCYDTKTECTRYYERAGVDCSVQLLHYTAEYQVFA